ncbi:hypothetical protein Fmac_015940 [Flemingia macrophylla]|uniref:DDE Tnp4 domain-containing protein n=1 Tax=Flemingia macrophylla TaxID=520843 RepID=A0ABD1MGL7_9FABA
MQHNRFACGHYCKLEQGNYCNDLASAFSKAGLKKYLQGMKKSQNVQIFTHFAAPGSLHFELHQLPFLATDFLGAIDGTHVRVKVPRSDAPRFRGRKDWPTQSVFAACNFDMKFTYVLGGWSNSRILKDVLSRQDPLIIPQG